MRRDQWDTFTRASGRLCLMGNVDPLELGVFGEYNGAREQGPSSLRGQP